MTVDVDWGTYVQGVHRKHARCYVTFAEEHTYDHPTLETELENLIETARWSRESGEHNNVLALTEWLYSGGGQFLNIQGHTHKAVQLLTWAVETAHATGDQREEGRLLGNLGLCWWAMGELRRAIDCYYQALEIARGTSDRQAEGRHLGSLGLAWATLMNRVKAIEYYEQALAIARETGDRQAEQSHIGCMGLVWAEEGIDRITLNQNVAEESYASYFQKAIEYYEQALRIAQDIGDRRGEGSHLGNIGNAWRYLGDETKSIKYFKQALHIFREIGDRRNEGFHLANLGKAYEALGKMHHARQCWQEALEIFDDIGDSRGDIARAWLRN